MVVEDVAKDTEDEKLMKLQDKIQVEHATPKRESVKIVGDLNLYLE